MARSSSRPAMRAAPRQPTWRSIATATLPAMRAHICSACNELLCATCGVNRARSAAPRVAPTVGAPVGRGAGAPVPSTSASPTCGDICHGCQVTCGVRQAPVLQPPARHDSVVGPDGAIELICPRCAVRCPGCQRFSAHTGVCDASGQRFCANCLVTCRGCGRTVVFSVFYHRNRSRRTNNNTATARGWSARIATRLLMARWPATSAAAKGAPLHYLLLRDVKCPVCEAHGVSDTRLRASSATRDLVEYAICSGGGLPGLHLRLRQLRQYRSCAPRNSSVQ